MATSSITLSPKLDAAQSSDKYAPTFPNLRIVRKTHRSPKIANPAKGLTYERMEKYIRLHENADELFDLFQKVQSAGRGYPYVKAWLFKQFPNYNDIPNFVNSKLRIVESAEAPKELAELARVCDISRTTTHKYIGLLE